MFDQISNKALGKKLKVSAVAGTQLCCALDPPRQALCLRMAYRVPYPNKILFLIPFPYAFIYPENPKEY